MYHRKNRNEGDEKWLRFPNKSYKIPYKHIKISNPSSYSKLYETKNYSGLFIHKKVDRYMRFIRIKLGRLRFDNNK